MLDRGANPNERVQVGNIEISALRVINEMAKTGSRAEDTTRELIASFLDHGADLEAKEGADILNNTEIPDEILQRIIQDKLEKAFS
jgi:hypothetical protein